MSEANLRRLNRSFEGLSFLYYSWPRRRMSAQRSQTRRKWNIGKGMSHLLTERLEPGSQKVEGSWMRNSATAAHIPSLPSGRRKGAATDTNQVLKALGWCEGPRHGMGPAVTRATHATHASFPHATAVHWLRLTSISMCPHTITLKTRIKKTRNKRTRMPRRSSPFCVGW